MEGSGLRTRMAVAWAVLGLITLTSVADRFVANIAFGNLSNAGFDREHTPLPSELGIPHQNVTFTSDGLRIAAWWMPGPDGPNATRTVVLVHGHSANMSKPVAHWAPNLQGAGYSLLALDLRNHGASDDGPGGFVTYGSAEARDVLAAVAWLRANATRLGVDPGRIALYGESMGAAAALIAAAERPEGVHAVVADSSYASFSFQAALDGAASGYPAFLVAYVVAAMDGAAPVPPTASHPDDALASLAIPVLLAHCEDDARLDAASFRALVARARHPPSTWFNPCPLGESDDRHGDGYANPGYNATVLAFLHASLA